jgi:hypothetical protein
VTGFFIQFFSGSSSGLVPVFGVDRFDSGNIDPCTYPEGPIRTVCQSTCACICQLWSVVVAPLGFYIQGNLLITGQIPKVR